jgi:hypothetical protein
MTSFIVDETAMEYTFILLTVSVPHPTVVKIEQIRRLPERVSG